MIDDMMDYGGSSGIYRQQAPLRPPPMMPPTSIHASLSPRFDNIMSRSSSVPWSPVPVDGNPYEKSTVDPVSTSYMYIKPSDMWTTNNNSNIKPSDGWMNNNPNIRPTEGWMNNNPNIRPTEGWMNNNPNIRPTEGWTNNNPNMKSSDGWMNNNIYTKSSEVWTNNNAQSRPLEPWSPSNNAQMKPTEQWPPSNHVQSKQVEPWPPNNNIPSKPLEPRSPNNNIPSKPIEPWSPSHNGQSKSLGPWSTSNVSAKRAESTIISNNSSNIPMLKSSDSDKQPGSLTDRCSPNCKLGILGFAIGFLAVGIALAVVLVLWLRQ